MAYATKEDYAEFWGYWQYRIDLSNLEAEELRALDSQIEMAAGDIQIALEQVGAGDCALSDAALKYLKKLNVINTAVTYRIPSGPRLDQDERALWMKWLSEQLDKLRSGAIELCNEMTSKEFPAIGVSQKAYTDWAQAELILKRLQRGGS